MEGKGGRGGKEKEVRERRSDWKRGRRGRRKGRTASPLQIFWISHCTGRKRGVVLSASANL